MNEQELTSTEVTYYFLTTGNFPEGYVLCGSCKEIIVKEYADDSWCSICLLED